MNQRVHHPKLSHLRLPKRWMCSQNWIDGQTTSLYTSFNSWTMKPLKVSISLVDGLTFLCIVTSNHCLTRSLLPFPSQTKFNIFSMRAPNSNRPQSPHARPLATSTCTNEPPQTFKLSPKQRIP